MTVFGRVFLIESLKSILKNNYKLKIQSDEKASYAKKIEKKKQNFSGIKALYQ